MDIDAIARLNVLWRPIYPYLAEWVRPWCPHDPGLALEVGPFSGGIGQALTSLLPAWKALFLTPQEPVARTIRGQFGTGLSAIVGSLHTLPFTSSLDLVLSRGAFFFLTPEMIREIYRVLRPGGRALLGGGYGPLTPREEIKKIADESRTLNLRLGKRWISTADLEAMVHEARLGQSGRILEEGGLWLLLDKPSGSALNNSPS